MMSKFGKGLKELPWMALARSKIGIEEIKGSRHNPVIIKWLDEMGQFSNEARAWWRDDETPWCGLFVGWILGKSGRYVVKEWYRAKEWASPKLTRLTKPAYGCLAVLDRKGGGHVGFVVGKTSNGKILLLGGNQGDMVQISAFDPGRITSYEWPSFWIDGEPLPSKPSEGRYELPILASDGKEVSLS